MQRLHWLALPVFCGIMLAGAAIWLLGAQTNRVAAETSEAHSAVILYVSTQGADGGNSCQKRTTPCRTIQHAIQVAQSGDYIHVVGGIYTDASYDPTLAMGVTATVIITKEISSLLGGYSPDFSNRNPNQYETILSAAGIPGAYVAVLVNTNVRFGGFTLSGGMGAYSPEKFYYPGGAIRVFGGSPTIQDNKITQNQAYRRGGGIYVGRNSTPTILNNMIISNTVITVEGDTASDGGGIYVASGPTLIQGNTILSNTAVNAGGGIFVSWNVAATIISNTISNNRLMDPVNAQGAGIHTAGDKVGVVIQGNAIKANALIGGSQGSALYISSPAQITANWIEDNHSTGRQSALSVANVMEPVTITNNIITENAGIALLSFNNQDIHIINNTIANNTLRGVQVFLPDALNPGRATFSLHNNIIVNNGECGVFVENFGLQEIDYNDVTGQLYQYCGFPDIQTHSLSIDPAFADPSLGDYHLLPGSPAINRGNDSIAPPTDFDGTRRTQHHEPDLGALEFVYLKLFLPVLQKNPPGEITP